jgi:hypothetical protein
MLAVVRDAPHGTPVGKEWLCQSWIVILESEYGQVF